VEERPEIAGTRITVYDVLEYMAGGFSNSIVTTSSARRRSPSTEMRPAAPAGSILPLARRRKRRGSTVRMASGDGTVPAVTSTPSSVPVRPNASSPTRSSQVRPAPSRGLRLAALWTTQAGWTASPGRGGGP
jgi:hypothetical protein